MIVYDSAGVKTAISPDGSGSVYDATGRRISASAVTANLYSYDNAPTSPNAYNDEFTSGALNAKWTIGSAGTTNPAVTGTIDYTASLTTPVIDLATQPSWAMFQSDNSTGQTFWIRQAYTAVTNSTFFIKTGCANRNVSAGGEGNLAFRLTNSGDANEALVFGVTHSGAGIGVFITVLNNGVAGSATNTTDAESKVSQPMYIVCWKKADEYHLGVSGGTGAFDYVGSVTKTGVTTFDQQQLEMTTANEVPSIVDGIDFYRYYPSVVYGLSNPAV